MQDCFRLHPDTYGDELANPEPPDDEESDITGAVEGAPLATISDTAPSSPSSIASTSTSTNSSQPESQIPPPPTLSPSDADINPAHTDGSRIERAKSAAEEVRDENGDTGEGGEELVTREWLDRTRVEGEK